LSVIPATKAYFKSAVDAYRVGLDSLSTSKSIVGGAMIGIGMTLSGACPGMVLAQIGTGTQNAIITISGCLAGALLYGLVHPYLLPSKRLGAKFVDETVSVNYTKIVIPVIVMLVSVIATVEYVIPWTTDIPVNVPLANQWNPIICGAIIGSLQLPLILSIQDTLGSSSSYCTVIANVLDASDMLSSKGSLSYFTRYLSGLGNRWQVMYVLGAMVGGAISALSSGSWGSAVGTSKMSAFIGGMCLLFGSRLASGCTSGHGISGFGLLSNLSILVVISMFGGGMASAFILKNIHFI
jgi:uncharacterized membrane protein YedE/YeeE